MTIIVSERSEVFICASFSEIQIARDVNIIFDTHSGSAIGMSAIIYSKVS